MQPVEIKNIIASIPEPIKKDIMTTYARIAEENVKKGEQIGIQKGEQIGIQKGEQIGIQKEKMEIVLNSFDNDISISLIASITKLLEKDVIKILTEHGRL